MIPIALIAGFLGSGKTTFLRRMAARHENQRMAYVINDFSSMNIDVQLLAGIKGNVVGVPGGSIFCRCRSGDFINALHRVSRILPAMEGVIVEASGMADPRAIATMLHDCRLDRVFQLTTVATVTDPGTFHKLLKTLPAVRAQVECADVVLLNKTDLFEEPAVLETEAAIRGVRDDVPIVRCVRGDAPVEFFHGVSNACKIKAELAPCRDPSFLSATFYFHENRDPMMVAGILQRHEKILWRAKGFVPTENGHVEMQWIMGPGAAKSRVHFYPAKTKNPSSALAVITRGDDEAGLEALTKELSSLARHVEAGKKPWTPPTPPS